jgi:hypothetical protein
MTNPISISPLRQRMIEDMTARGLGQQTQRGHIRVCKRFAVSNGAQCGPPIGVQK